ncbi:conserved Plasmodium protein, unknown function [Plasmodium reichenowi]|uniref:Uncharacterized protein n=1 Tax=Plasmodium reichenowi TaxID=5854 RepID=A0A2P9DLJ0_PLARE|nr:conserved Plasmodium protein, unknown function [Plasmodium reichenowi]
MENIEKENKEENYLDRLTNLFKYLTLGVEKNNSTEKNSTHSIKYDGHKNSLQQVVYNLKLKRASELSIPHRILGNTGISKNDSDKERDNNTKREENEDARDSQIYDHNICGPIKEHQDIQTISLQQEDDKKVYFYSSSIDLEHGEIYKIDQAHKKKKKKKKKKKEKHKDEHEDEHKNEHKDEHKNEHKDEHKNEHKDEHKNEHKDEHKDTHNDKHKDTHNDKHKDKYNDKHKDKYNDKHIKKEKQTNVEKNKKHKKRKSKSKLYELEEQNYSKNKIKLIDSEKENILMTNLKSFSSSNNSQDIKKEPNIEQNIINNNLYTLDKNKTYISIRSNKEKNRVIKLPKLNFTNNFESSND